MARPSMVVKSLSYHTDQVNGANGVNGDTKHDYNQSVNAGLKGITFAGQSSLQRLPIPTLSDTCDKYLRALKPFQSKREYQITEAAVKDFLQNDGPALQRKLEKYANGRTNYIEEFWYDSYLSFDNPVVLNLNPFFLLEDDPTPARNQQIPRAASLVISALSFVRALRNEELLPDEFRGSKLCMNQYSRLFGTSRIPTKSGCVMNTDLKSRHVIVVYRSQFYWFDVLDPENEVILTEKEMQSNLDAIMKDADSLPVRDLAKSAVGVLTTENRRTWAGLREHLLSGVDKGDDGVSMNQETLKLVDSALFILCLDDTEPETCAELSSNMLSGSYRLEDGVQMGTCTNRWYDKLQIIVCRNGSAGVNFEHTGVDGHTVLRFVSDIYTDTILRFAQSINPMAPTLWSTNHRRASEVLSHVSIIDTLPHKLEWNITPELSTGIRFAESRLSDLILQNDVDVLEFRNYGKGFITAMGFSPDAFVQMAFQAAYYGLYGRPEITYEPAMTKKYLHGRTEAIYAVTQESVNFVRRFWEDVSVNIKMEALKKGCDAHVKITRDCSVGRGHHRHLYALLCIWKRNYDAAQQTPPSSDPCSGKSQIGLTEPTDSNTSDSGSTSCLNEEELPAIFADGGWDKMANIILSTSNCGNPSLRMFGFGPVNADGKLQFVLPLTF